MIARILSSITCVAVATIYALCITHVISNHLHNITSIGVWLFHVPTVVFLFIGLVMAISPDWDKAEF